MSERKLQARDTELGTRAGAVNYPTAAPAACGNSPFKSDR